MNHAVSSSAASDASWDHSFLEWFSALSDVTVFEKKRELGGFHYHQFIARFADKDGRTFHTFGRSQNRLRAAVKCAAECVERKAMLEYFSSYSGEIPPELHTSNGWAVHRSAQAAKSAALEETLERHLLLKTYLAKGWRGFRLFDLIESPEIKLHFLTSVYQTEEHVAALVAASSPHYPGVSFGYCLGRSSDISEGQFWESALFEAVDRILTLEGGSVDLSHGPQSWILKTSKEFLEEPFDPICFREGLSEPTILEPSRTAEIEFVDLGERWGLRFPLYAAFARGFDFIPLFPTTDLTAETREYLGTVLGASGIFGSQFPIRHPIL